jgi:hypothetical protein
MSRLLGHRPSPAMVVALLALFIALAGTSYAAIKLPANSVGTKQIKANAIVSRTIKNGAIHRVDLAADAVDSARVADHTLLARDFKAGQLPAGLPGPAGPKGDAGATRLVVRTSSGHGIQRTDCLPGEVATGGGAHSPDGYVIASIPASHPQAPFAQNGPPTQYPAPTSWEARAVKVNVSGTGTITSVDDADLTTWVVCAAP